MTDKKDLNKADQLDLMKQELSEEVGSEKSVGTKRRFFKSKTYKIIENCLFAAAVIALSLILASVLMAKANGKTPEVFGFQLYRIESGSMDPTLPVGTLIFSRKPGDPSSLAKGDIITFTNSDGLTVTHRIVEVVSSNNSISYRTKGDNPINIPDKELVRPEMINGVFVFKVPLT